MASIETRNVTVRRGDAVVLDDISISVPAGTTTVVLAIAGAGSTTLLRVLAGLDDHDSGDVRIGGSMVNMADPLLRKLALVAAEPVLHPRLDVFDNLTFAAGLEPDRDATAVAADATAVAQMLGLADLLEVRADQLDAAQRQRVGIGRELIREADGYLFDNPFSAQPERIRPHLRSMVNRWQRGRGRTSIVVSDSVAEALSLADQLVVLHRGVVRQIGEPRQVFADPADVVVASVVGSPQMNLFPASVDAGGLATPIGRLPAVRTTSSHRSVIVGIRPDRVRQLAEGEPAGPDAAEFAIRVAEVEWRGTDQYVFGAIEVVAGARALLTQLEELSDIDLFQDVFQAVLPADAQVATGDPLRLAVDQADVHVFETHLGEALPRPAAADAEPPTAEPARPLWNDAR